MVKEDEARLILRSLSHHLTQSGSRDVFYESYLKVLQSLRTPIQRNTNEHIESIVAELSINGFCSLGKILNSQDVENCLRVLDSAPLNNTKENTAFSSLEQARHSNVGEVTYSDIAVYSIDRLIEIANDPGILDIVSSYLGVLPTIQHILCTRSFSGSQHLQEHFTKDSRIKAPDLARAQTQNQLFHADSAGPRFLKLCIYLTDVDQDSGPHEFITGSHRDSDLSDILERCFESNPDLRNQWKAQYRKSEDLISEIFPKESFKEFIAERGFAFLEDTSGMHRGRPPVSQDRVFCQILYTMHDDFFGREPNLEFRNTSVLPSLLNQTNGQYSEKEIKYINRLVLAEKIPD